MSTYAEKEPQKTSLRYFKYTLIYILLIPFINWSFTWAPMVELPGLAAWAFNPVTIVTGLVLVVRDFAQREIGHEVLIAMAIALFLTFVTSGGALALASGAAFLISELVDWAMFTFTKYKLSTRVVCPECAHEWSNNPEFTNERVYKDANGNLLAEGDWVTIIKDLKVKGTSKVAKVGTKVKINRLMDEDHDIDCKIDGIGAMKLKTMFVKKA